MNTTSSVKQMSPGKKFFFTRIFPLIFFVAGAIMAFIGISQLFKAMDSKNWPTADGKVISASVETHRSSGDHGNTHITYHAKIRYRFSVDGQAFNGDRVAYGDYGSSNSSHARRVVNRYPKGKRVSVYYMPENPRECLLEAGLKLQSFLLPVVGIVFLTIGVFMAIALPRKIAQQESNI